MPTAFEGIPFPAGFYDVMVKRYGNLFHVKPYVIYPERPLPRRLPEEAGVTGVWARVSSGLVSALALHGCKLGAFIARLGAYRLAGHCGLLLTAEAGCAR